MVTTPKNNYDLRKLNKNQLDLLKLCLKFRFIESRIVGWHRQKSTNTVNQSLRRLMKYGLITRHYPNHYLIQGRPAEYYLSLVGIRFIKSILNTTPKAQKAMYNNPLLSQAFVSKCLYIYHLYVQLQKQYGKKLKMFTKSETADIEDMIHPLPDLFMQFGDNDYYLDALYQEPYFVVIRRIGQIFKDFEQTDLDKSSYPTLLLVLADDKTERKVNKYIELLKARRFIDNDHLKFMTTTVEAVSSSTDKKIWTKTNDSQVLVGLV